MRAKIRYLDPDWRGRTERPRIASRETRRANTRFYDVRIENARPLQERGELDLDTSGFILAQHRTQVGDFRDPAEVRRTYYPGIRELIQRLTGASDLAVYGHVVRTEDSSSFDQAYARYVHCDFSEASGRDMSRRLMVEHGICTEAETEHFYFAWYNTWQPIDREVQQNPLTLIDSRSLETEDVVEYMFGEPGLDGIASMPFYSSKHHHYYFPLMQTDELIVLKQLDSRPRRSSLCPHTSFDDTTARADALRRRSIEVRLMCVFPRSPRDQSPTASA
ncbi:MAG: CmcJ/NvfI family oxidoreductase [Myxococcota bacterium]